MPSLPENLTKSFAHRPPTGGLEAWVPTLTAAVGALQNLTERHHGTVLLQEWALRAGAPLRAQPEVVTVSFSIERVIQGHGATVLDRAPWLNAESDARNNDEVVRLRLTGKAAVELVVSEYYDDERYHPCLSGGFLLAPTADALDAVLAARPPLQASIDLRTAIRADDVATVRAALAAGAEPSPPFAGYSGCGLDVALEGGAARVLPLLIAHGEDLAARDHRDATLLHRVAARQVRAAWATDPLVAGELAQGQLCDMAQGLVDAGVELDAVDDLGDTALHRAARYRNNALIPVLLRAGVDVTIADKEGHTVDDLADDVGRAMLASWRAHRLMTNSLHKDSAPQP